MPSTCIFATDERYDRDHASDYRSRYGAYLRQNVALFLDFYDEPTRDRLEFAAAAWRVAQSPVMSPGYVIRHPRIVETSAAWDFEGRMGITVAVAAEVPRQLARSLYGSWRGWDRQYWAEPEDNNFPVATALLRFRVPMSPDGLPVPSYSPAAVPNTDTAKAAVEVICGRLNSALAGVFSQFSRKEVA
ncbi:hypothetical protein GCM10025787_38110 [Saccharopolyspora rosea]|uniref:Uncharacterized protein n=1 Tax=Saccharopolyspora rosea TaxID=524884 RepID=A0ABW3FMQ2_9PSEU